MRMLTRVDAKLGQKFGQNASLAALLLGSSGPSTALIGLANARGHRPERATRAPVRCTAGLGRVGANGILSLMTRTLDAVIAKLATLPADEQDRIAQWLLDELGDDEHWARQFATSQDALSKLAAEARAERAAGRATELDPDKL